MNKISVESLRYDFDERSLVKTERQYWMDFVAEFDLKFICLIWWINFLLLELEVRRGFLNYARLKNPTFRNQSLGFVFWYEVVLWREMNMINNFVQHRPRRCCKILKLRKRWNFFLIRICWNEMILIKDWFGKILFVFTGKILKLSFNI